MSKSVNIHGILAASLALCVIMMITSLSLSLSLSINAKKRWNLVMEPQPTITEINKVLDAGPSVIRLIKLYLWFLDLHR
jgi:hypothetical protein